MKKVWIIYAYGSLPGEKYLEARHVRFGKRLSKLGYEVVFWTANFFHGTKEYRCTGWKEIKICDNFFVKLVPTKSYTKNISLGRVAFEMSFARELKKAFKKEDAPDIIITPGTGLVTSFRPIWPYIKGKKIKTIYDIMDIHLFNGYMEKNHKSLLLFSKLLTKLIETREKEFYRNVNAICGLGKNQVEIAKLRTGKPDIPSCLVYNGISVDGFRQKMDNEFAIELPQKEDEIWCVYAGALSPSYDILAMIDCAKIAMRNNNKIRFIIAGMGPNTNIVKNAADEIENITFLGLLDADALPALYKCCDIGLCAYSSYSTVDMPDKFYDYTAAGLAVVNSLKGEVGEHVEKSELGVNYTAEDSESMYSAINKTIEGLEMYKKNSYSIAEQFDFDNAFSQLITVMDRL